MSRTRLEYFTEKEKLEGLGIAVVLVDLVSLPRENSQKLSETMFDDAADGSYFALYCDSGCMLSSFTRQELEERYPQHIFVDISSGAGMYELEYQNHLYEKRLGKG